MTKKAKLLWLDLEMTGLDPAKDQILEIAAIATDWEFQEIATYEAIIKVDTTVIKQRMTGQFWETHHVARDALIEQNDYGNDVLEVESELCEFLDKHFDTKAPILLAGNSIYQDRKFIDKQWPKFAKKLHYRMLDVSAWKVVFEGKYRKKFAKPESHRALADIRGSIEELEYYLKKLNV